ncbi:Uncharacterised protein [uncultured archaeon]|nr:Uncharacterised protein [uncultured archaeon]
MVPGRLAWGSGATYRVRPGADAQHVDGALRKLRRKREKRKKRNSRAQADCFLALRLNTPAIRITTAKAQTYHSSESLSVRVF